MSKTRSLTAFTAGLAMLCATAWLATTAFPLSGAPQTVADSQGVTVDLNGAQLLHRSAVVYPHGAGAAGVQGTVVVQVKTDESGNVTDANILSGPEELRKSVLQSVLNWHFAHGSAATSRQISVTFQAPAEPQAVSMPEPAEVRGRITSAPPPTPMPARAVIQPSRVASISVQGLTDEASNDLRPHITVRIGDTLDRNALTELQREVREFDPHLIIQTRRDSSGDAHITIAPADYQPQTQSAPPDLSGKTLSVGGLVQQANLISKTDPVYPEVAKQARIEGKVILATVIGPDGRVIELHVVSGPALLIQSAIQAVKNWVYKPTIVNGQPVAVSTTVTVNYTLSQ